MGRPRWAGTGGAVAAGRRWLWAVLAVAVGTGSCADFMVGPGPEATALATFEAVWSEFDALYPFFGSKALDWDEVGDRYRAEVEGAGQAQLLSILDRMLQELDDGHVFLRTPDTTVYSTASRRDDPAYYDPAVVVTRYLTAPPTEVADGRIEYGRIGEMGYIRIGTLSGVDGLFGGTGAWTTAFDSVLAELADATALVIDIRSNGGGSLFNGLHMAGRFATDRRVVIRSQFRSGPGRSEFSSPEPLYLEPRTPHVDRPVALLVNGHVGSAAETLTLAMKGLPRVRVVGTRTAGAMGHQIERGLPNGWSFGLPVARVFTAEGELLEGIGVEPDTLVVPTAEDEASGRDAILEAGLSSLNAL